MSEDIKILSEQEFDEQTKKVVGDRVLIFGDLHLSDVYDGKHKSYLSTCTKTMRYIQDVVEAEKPCAIVLLGDIIGVNEGNLKNPEILNLVIKWLVDLNKLCKVYAVRGNHDFHGSCPDFNILQTVGLITTSYACDGFFDFYGEENNENPEIRFHIVDYGRENKELTTHNVATNIVLGHNNYTIQGVTTWYRSKDGVELSMLSNFSNVYMVVSGHIHNPSPEIYSTSMVGGGDCGLFYPGCPTRPSYEKNMYTSCYYMRFSYDKEKKESTFDAVTWELPKIEDEFNLDEKDIKEETMEQINETIRNVKLKEILEEAMKYRISSNNLEAQIDAIPYATQEAKDMAKKYLRDVSINRAS